MDKKLILVTLIIILVVLLAGSFYTWFYIGDKKGFLAGKEQGFKDGQKAAQDVIDAANPYVELENAANPFQGEYENPF